MNLNGLKINFMKQYEAVIETIRQLGGIATLGEINQTGSLWIGVAPQTIGSKRIRGGNRRKQEFS